MNRKNITQMAYSLRWFRSCFGSKLTTTQLEVLLYVVLHPGSTIKETASDLGLDSSYVSKCLATFERGYRHKKQLTSVVQRYKDRYSKRLIRIRLSAHGNYIFDQFSQSRKYTLSQEWYKENPAKILYTFQLNKTR